MSGKPIKVLLVEDNPGDARLVSELLSETQAVTFDLAEVRWLREALKRLGEESFDAVLLDLRLPDSEGLDTFLRIHESFPGLPVIVLTGLADEELGTNAVAQGAQDYLTKGKVDGELLARSIRYAIVRHAPTRGRGHVLGFMGAKGGVGTTTVALNVAAVFAGQGKSVVAAEIRPDYGTFSAQLGRAPVENLSHVCKLQSELITERELSARLLSFGYGLRALFGPQIAEEFGEFTPAKISAAIEVLASMYGNVVLDICNQFSDAVKEAIRHCDYITLVTTPDPASMASAKAKLAMLKEWGAKPGRCGLMIVNITPLFTGLDLRELRSEMGCEIVGVLPSAPDDIVAARHKGEPLVIFKPASLLAQNLTEVAGKLAVGGGSII